MEQDILTMKHRRVSSTSEVGRSTPYPSCIGVSDGKRLPLTYTSILSLHGNSIHASNLQFLRKTPPQIPRTTSRFRAEWSRASFESGEDCCSRHLYGQVPGQFRIYTEVRCTESTILLLEEVILNEEIEHASWQVLPCEEEVGGYLAALGFR